MFVVVLFLGVEHVHLASAAPIGKAGYSVQLVSNSVVGPSSGLVLRDGDLFLGEGFLPGYSNQNVVRLSPAAPGAAKTTYATGLYIPDEVAFRPDGVLFVVERYAATPGIYTVPVGGGVASLFLDFPTGGLTYPTGIIFGPDGALYVQDASADFMTGYIKVFDPYSAGPPSSILTDPFPGSGMENSTLEGIAFDSGGNMYNARVDISQIDVYQPATGTWTSFTYPMMEEPIGIGIGPVLGQDGEFIYAANWHCVTRSRLDGSECIEVASGFLNTMGVAVDSNGRVFVGDNSDDAVYVLVIPEPASIAVLALGATALLIAKRRYSV